MTAVGKKRQTRRNEKYALLMVEARLLGISAYLHSNAARTRASRAHLANLTHRIYLERKLP